MTAGLVQDPTSLVGVSILFSAWKKEPNLSNCLTILPVIGKFCHKSPKKFEAIWWNCAKLSSVIEVWTKLFRYIPKCIGGGLICGSRDTELELSRKADVEQPRAH